MVDEITILLTYFPLAEGGLALMTLEISAPAFSASLVASKETFPTGQWIMPVLSTRNSTLPAFTSLTARTTSNVTVPVLGLGISPRGPSTLPSRPTDFIMSGVATTASKSIQPPWILWTISSPPDSSAPASRPSRTLSPEAITITRLDLPSPWGRTTVPRTIWSACLGSTPKRIATSTVSSNFANAAFLTNGMASVNVYAGLSTSLADASYFFPTLAIPASPSLVTAALRRHVAG